MRVCFETYGCTMNQGDTEIMKALVSREHELVRSPEESDVVVLNSCGVIGYTERKILRRVSGLKGQGKKVLLAGCLPLINQGAVLETGADAVLPSRRISHIGEALQSLSTNKIAYPENGFEKAGIPKVRESSCIAIIPIAEGCLGSCAYCATRFARGRLRSFSIDSIVREAEECVDQGYKEIQLTAQDTAAYGMDNGSTLPGLVERICDVKGEFRVRVGMMNPRHVSGNLEELIEACRDEKVYKFFHLPLQSGDDAVLRDMGRGYTVMDFKRIVKALRKGFPRLALSTDVIAGYPTEDDGSFKRTYELIRAIKPDVLNITKFSPRPDTKAFNLKDMPDRYKKQRSRKLASLHRNISLTINKKLIGHEFNVLITKNGKNSSLLGRTDFYTQVVMRSGKIGQFKKTMILNAEYNYLIGN